MVSGAAQPGQLRADDPHSRHASRPGQPPDSTRRWMKLGGNVTISFWRRFMSSRCCSILQFCFPRMNPKTLVIRGGATKVRKSLTTSERSKLRRPFGWNGSCCDRRSQRIGEVIDDQRATSIA